jgi:hypothetical protein
VDSPKFIAIPESNAELIVGGGVTIKSTSQNIRPGLNQSLNQSIVTDESLGLSFSGLQKKFFIFFMYCSYYHYNIQHHHPSTFLPLIF